ncbi:MAG: BrnT family toxin [Acidobacteriia bacterium]|nr:BrnT family toxin [Terriglobia bacterium]
MRFAWDGQKSRRNLAKHHVSFETARLVFDDPRAISRLDRMEDGEERWQTLGLVGGIAVLLVAHTYREEDGEEVMRIISARKATPHERRIYEQGI